MNGGSGSEQPTVTYFHLFSQQELWGASWSYESSGPQPHDSSFMVNCSTESRDNRVKSRNHVKSQSHLIKIVISSNLSTWSFGYFLRWSKFFIMFQGHSSRITHQDTGVESLTELILLLYLLVAEGFENRSQKPFLSPGRSHEYHEWYGDVWCKCACIYLIGQFSVHNV